MNDKEIQTAPSSAYLLMRAGGRELTLAMKNAAEFALSREGICDTAEEERKFRKVIDDAKAWLEE